MDTDRLVKMSQAELDQLYRESPPGPIPVGVTKGTAIVLPGTFFVKLARFLGWWLFWQGKVFLPTEEGLINRVSPFRFRAIRAKVYKGPSWLDGKETIVIDYSKTSLVARMIRDEIRQVAPDLYLGKVWFGRTRLL